MHTIPVTILDNFFDDPDSIRKWALQQEYFPAEDGQWPGVRTKPLYEINPGLNEVLCHRYFNLFFDLRLGEPIHWTVDARFQLADKNCGQGWIHTDNDSRLTAIIYLTPNPDPATGTSIYARKNGVDYVSANHLNNYKVDQYLNKISKEEADPYRKQLSEGFVETIRVNNVYNRMVTFDGHLKHAAHDYFGENSSDARLTLVMFIIRLYADHTPVSRHKLIG